MADNSFRIDKSLSLVPNSGAPANLRDGDIWYDSALAKFRKRQNGATSDLDTTASGGWVPATSTKTANYTAVAADDFLLFDCSSGPLTCTLTAAGTVGAKVFFIKKIDSSMNSLTIARSSTDTIDGDTSLVITESNVAVTIHCNGTLYYLF